MKHSVALTSVAALTMLVLSACEPLEHANKGVKAIKGASTLQCNDARMQLQAIVDNYSILEGRVPLHQAELVPKYLREINPLVEIDPSGKVVFAASQGC